MEFSIDLCETLDISFRIPEFLLMAIKGLISLITVNISCDIDVGPLLAEAITIPESLVMMLMNTWDVQRDSTVLYPYP